MSSLNEENDSREIDKLSTAIRRIEEGEDPENVLGDFTDFDSEIDNLQESPNSEIRDMADFLSDTDRVIKVKETITRCLSEPDLEAPMALVGLVKMLRSSDFPVDRGYILNNGFRRRDWFIKVRETISSLTLHIISKYWDIRDKEAVVERLNDLSFPVPNLLEESSQDSDKVIKVLGWKKLVENLTRQEILTLASFWFADYIKNEKGVYHPHSITFLENSLWELLEDKYGRGREKLRDDIEDRVKGLMQEKNEVAWREILRFPW